MSFSTARLRSYTEIQTDRWGMLLALLFLAVLAGAVWMGSLISGFTPEPVMGGSSSGAQAAGGAGWALAEAGIAVLLLGVIALWNRLPDWVHDIVKTGVFLLLAMVLGVVSQSMGLFWVSAAIVLGYYTVNKVADVFDVYWLWNNIEAIVIATVGGAYIGLILPLPFLIIGILGLTVYDHYFANQSDRMFKIGEGMLRAKLPVIVFAIPTLYIPWESICDSVGGDKDAIEDDRLRALLENKQGFGIGTADLMIPAAFAVAVSTAGASSLPVVGIAAGVALAAFRLRWEIVNIGSGAGLPALSAGMVGGWVIGLAVVAL